MSPPPENIAAPWRRKRQLFRLFGTILSSRLGIKKTPFFLSHLVTARCTCGCPTCIWRDNRSPEMNTEEVESLYREAAAMGFVANVIWGGEPLLREDLPHLCRVSRQEGMSTIIITNGYSLPERFHELCPEVESIIVSLDYADAARHDASRHCKGLFERTLQGTQRVREHFPQVKVVINYLLQNDNLNEIEGITALAKELNVSLYMSPAMEGENPDTGSSNRSSLAGKNEKKEAAHKLLELKKTGAPVNNSQKYLQDYLGKEKNFTCRVPLIFLNVLPDGTLLNCFTPGKSLGRYQKNNLHTLIAKQERKERLQLGQGCQKCVVPDVVETSYIWGLCPEPLLNTLSVFGSP